MWPHLVLARRLHALRDDGTTVVSGRGVSQGDGSIVLVRVRIHRPAVRAPDNWRSDVLHSHSKAAIGCQAGLVGDRIGHVCRANVKVGSAGNGAVDSLHAPVVTGSRCIPADDGKGVGCSCVDFNGVGAGDGRVADVLHHDDEGACPRVASSVGCCCCHLYTNL